MAVNEGRREVVNDPLAPNPREQQPDRSLAVMGVRAPMTPSAASLSRDNGLDAALGGVERAFNGLVEKQKDEWVTEGKVAYQQGVSEADMLASGNKFTAKGYRTLQARDFVNNWFTESSIELDESGHKIAPEEYAARLKTTRSTVLDKITDPDARKVASAAFEDMSPRLTRAHAVKHNEYNRVERVKSFTDTLYSTAPTSATASKREPNAPLALTPTPVEHVMQPSSKDRDIGIRTMIGEAANEGAEGLAAVAHVIRNRAVDGRWPNSIAGVALQEKQFSAWNSGAGGNNLVRQYGPGHPIYERAGQVFDAVMSGRHVDPTGGATHYYSPSGMKALVAAGSQTNEIPTWLDAETQRSGGAIKIGGHVFVGKRESSGVRPAVETTTSLSSGTRADLNAVPATEGVATTGVASTGGGTEVQELIRGYKGLNDADKATAVADAMRRGLDAGDDTLFRDAGGVAILRQLGAKPGEVDEVLKARKRFDDGRMKDFNVSREKYRNDILTRAESGESFDTLLADIDKHVKSGDIDDANARALAHSAADKVRQQAGKSKSQMANVDMLNELGGLYQQVSTGADFKTMAEQGKAIATKYGATEEDVQRIVGKMFSEAEQYKDKLRTQTEAAVKSKAEQDAVKGEVTRALSQGYGLGAISSGTRIKVMNDHGQPTTVSAEEFGVMQIKDKWAKLYSDAVNAGKMTAEQARPELERKVILELQNHGVVDKQMQKQIQGALAGNILDPKSKTGLRDSAREAYNTFLTLKTTPGIQPGYLSKMIGDDHTRSLLETAFLMDAGDLSKDQALVKAHEILSDPNRDPEARINKDAVWRIKLDKGVREKLYDRADPGFFSRIFGSSDLTEQNRIVTNSKVAENYVVNRSEAYHLQNPNEPGEVSLEKALQDLEAHSVPVMGNLIINRPGKELDKQMGLQTFGPRAAHDAMETFVRKNASTLWPTVYDKQKPNPLMQEIRGANSTIQRAATYINPNAAVPMAPPVQITYNAELGVVTVDLYKDGDAKSGRTLGQPKTFFVKDIGAAYIKEQTTPSTWAKTWNSMFKGTAKAVKGVLE